MDKVVKLMGEQLLFLKWKLETCLLVWDSYGSSYECGVWHVTLCTFMVSSILEESVHLCQRQQFPLKC
jgi:hypothetical protein